MVCIVFGFLVASDKIELSSLISVGNEFQITEMKYLEEFLYLKTEVTTRSGLDG